MVYDILGHVSEMHFFLGPARKKGRFVEQLPPFVGGNDAKTNQVLTRHVSSITAQEMLCALVRYGRVGVLDCATKRHYTGYNTPGRQYCLICPGRQQYFALIRDQFIDIVHEDTESMICPDNIIEEG